MTKLVEYNPEWKNFFKEESKKLKKNIGKNCLSVMHIGSTAVRGALATPIVDMLVVVKDDNLLEITCAILEDMNYVEQGNVFFKECTNISYSVRLVNKKNEEEYTKYISVVHYLENDKKILDEFNKKKQEIYDMTDENKYTEERKNFFNDLQVKAINWNREQEHITECTSIGMCLGMSMGLLFFDSMVTGMLAGLLIGYLIGKFGNKEIDLDKDIDFKFGKKK